MYYEIKQTSHPESRSLVFEVTPTESGQEIDEFFNPQDSLYRGIRAACNAGTNFALDRLWEEHEDFVSFRQRLHYNDFAVGVRLHPSSRRRIEARSTKQEADLVFFKFANILGDISKTLEDFVNSEVTAALPQICKKIERKRWDDSRLSERRLSGPTQSRIVSRKSSDSKRSWTRLPRSTGSSPRLAEKSYSRNVSLATTLRKIADCLLIRFG